MREPEAEHGWLGDKTDMVDYVPEGCRNGPRLRTPRGRVSLLHSIRHRQPSYLYTGGQGATRLLCFFRANPASAANLRCLLARARLFFSLHILHLPSPRRLHHRQGSPRWPPS